MASIDHLNLLAERGQSTGDRGAHVVVGFHSPPEDLEVSWAHAEAP